MMKKEQLTLKMKMSALAEDQNDWILKTKLNPPVLRSDIVERPHLLAKLEKNIQRSFTLIAAPAGYGKSTLVAQWLEASSVSGVWISLDRGDNDLATFLSYVVAAVRRLESNACQRIHNLLDVKQHPPPEILVKFLANDLGEISKPFLLVLDDYHLVTNPDIQNLLERLLLHPPPSLHLTIVTRRDPPFPLVTMKARGQSVEIRESDLQFDAVETGRLFERAHDIHLDEEGLSRIMDKMEGWITGLQLFCLALEKGDDPEDYLSGISEDTIHVQSYLVDQVLSQQTPEMKDWLLKTSVLNRFCASLCDAVCNDSPGENDAKRAMSGLTFMETVTEGKLFGIKLEARGDWIRYHHLFQELLHNHLRKVWDPQDIAFLHRRAALWFGEQGLVEEGLRHAKAAGDFEIAADIIEDNRSDMMKMDKWQRLGRCLDSLPSAVENLRPHLLMSRAYVLMYSGRFAEIPAHMDKVVMLVGESPSDPMLGGELHFFRGIITFFMGEMESRKRHFDTVLATATSLECRAESELHGCVALHLDGKQDLAISRLRTAIQRNESRSLFYLSRFDVRDQYGSISGRALACVMPDGGESGGTIPKERPCLGRSLGGQHARKCDASNTRSRGNRTQLFPGL